MCDAGILTGVLNADKTPAAGQINYFIARWEDMPRGKDLHKHQKVIA